MPRSGTPPPSLRSGPAPLLAGLGARLGARCAVPTPAGSVDARGVRFAAALSSGVLGLVLLSGSGWLLAAQGTVFALGAFAGPRFAPYAVLFRVLVAPRLGPPTRREPAAPVRFSQALGLGFAVVGTVGYLAGLPTIGIVATALAFAAAVLNAAFGFCLGCELYTLFIRLTTRHSSPNSRDRQGATA